MISLKCVYKYCCEDLSMIENYDKAINDKTKIWHCHHRKETDNNLSIKQLKDKDLYYNRPANELIFLTNADHTRIHMKGIHHPLYGIKQSEETRNKRANSNRGKKRSAETKNKLSECQQGRKMMTNGITRTFVKPDQIEYYLNNGYHFGMT